MAKRKPRYKIETLCEVCGKILKTKGAKKCHECSSRLTGLKNKGRHHSEVVNKRKGRKGKRPEHSIVMKKKWENGEFKRTHNSTEKQKESIRKVARICNTSSIYSDFREKRRQRIIEYNKSEKHRNIMSRIGKLYGVPALQRPESKIKSAKSLGKLSHNGRTTLEIKMKSEFEKLGLKFEPQYPIKRKMTGRFYFLDFAFPECMIGVECDGEQYHQDKEKEFNRQKELEDLGWNIIHFTGKEIKNDIVKCVKKFLEIKECHA